MRCAVIVCFALFLSACNSVWTPVRNADQVYLGDRYQVELPHKWLYTNTKNTGLTLSLDGPYLHAIHVEEALYLEAFRSLQRPLSKSVLPSELAELYLARLKKSPENGGVNIETLSNRPALLGGQDGFFLHLRLKSSDGLDVDVLVYGVLRGEHFFSLSYTAPKLWYFPRDKNSFEKMVGSFRFI